MTDAPLLKKLSQFAKEPAGMKDFQVHHPASCASPRESSEPFTLRLADFESRVKSTLSGGNDLIAKPFLFLELAVKALTLLLKSQLAAKG